MDENEVEAGAEKAGTLVALDEETETEYVLPYTLADVEKAIEVISRLLNSGAIPEHLKARAVSILKRFEPAPGEASPPAVAGPE